jgi:hypothetical protein
MSVPVSGMQNSMYGFAIIQRVLTWPDGQTGTSTGSAAATGLCDGDALIASREVRQQNRPLRVGGAGEGGEGQ